MNNLETYLHDSKPTLIEAYTPGCQRCTRMEPIIAELAAKKGDRVNIVPINGKDNPDIIAMYHVRACPAWILFKDGQEVWRDYGEKPYSELADMVDRFI